VFDAENGVVANMNTRGAQAEQLAAQFLQRHGLKLLQRNYSCRYGEIDLILQDGDTLVFAEVRLRSRGSFGGAAASIDAAKQGRLIHAAQHYLATLSRVPPCRFDALLFDTLDSARLEWIRNAFTA
jgi:putative endonuclease